MVEVDDSVTNVFLAPRESRRAANDAGDPEDESMLAIGSVTAEVDGTSDDCGGAGALFT